MTFNPFLSLVPLVLLFAGFRMRRRRRIHIALMVVAMILDAAMIVHLEISRHVLAKAARPATTILVVHIGLATAAVLGYLVNLGSGLWIVRKAVGRRFHRTTGIGILVVRTLVSATAFLVT